MKKLTLTLLLIVSILAVMFTLVACANNGVCSGHVWDELEVLEQALTKMIDLLAPGGRICIITFHSLEDRIVKNFLRSGNLDGTIEKDFYGNILTPFKVLEKGLTASVDEVERNPRARSAKLRVAEKI